MGSITCHIVNVSLVVLTSMPRDVVGVTPLRRHLPAGFISISLKFNSVSSKVL